MSFAEEGRAYRDPSACSSVAEADCDLTLGCELSEGICVPTQELEPVKRLDGPSESAALMERLILRHLERMPFESAEE